ncbi:MAG: thioredoxin domain-containing protein [Ignavibacteriales bacterium]|nr:thioredoxin domain-containing protein [Ignavibacteriales bacterium]
MTSTNRLARETSPYLLQHAHNPVDWYPWGEEAFDARPARGQAGLPLHRLFDLPLVPRDGTGVLRGRGGRPAPQRGTSSAIKVDREERPDVDQHLHGRLPEADRHGRLAADGRHDARQAGRSSPGPTFRSRGRCGRPGLLEILPLIREAWRTKRPDILRSADEIARLARARPRSPGGPRRAAG